MRKLILIVTVLLNCLPMFSQVGDVEVKEKPVFVGSAQKSPNSLPKLEFYNTEQGRYYTLIYQNADYPNIVDIKIIGFFATEEDIQYIYEFLKDGYGNEEDRSLKLGDDEIRTMKTVSKKSIYVFASHKNDTDGFFFLTSKQLERLFGKE